MSTVWTSGVDSKGAEQTIQLAPTLKHFDVEAIELAHDNDFYDPVFAEYAGHSNEYIAGTTSFTKDENEQRGNWEGRLDFVLSGIGYMVGLGNVWRFPFLCYRNGGGVFLIPYAVMLIFVGLPLSFLESALGQFSSSSAMTCWRICPFFLGQGLGIFLVTFLASVYYAVIISWALFYLFASFVSPLPWFSCPPDVDSELCSTFLLPPRMTIEECNNTKGNHPNLEDGFCYHNDTKIGTWNASLKIPKISRSEIYMNYRVLGVAKSEGLHDLGILHWETSLCLLLLWLLTFFSLFKGIKSSGKVIYFTAIFPYILLILLMVRGAMLDGHLQGVEFYIIPDFSRLAQSSVWVDALNQVIWSLALSQGGLTTLSSYNRFHSDCLRDSLIICFVDFFSSFFAGFVIFMYVGELAHIMNVTIPEVAKEGMGLAFVVYPEVMKNMPLPNLWSIIFFLLLLTLGIDSHFGAVEVMATSLMDMYPSLRKKTGKILAILCITLCICGLPICTDGGAYLLTFLDSYVGGSNVIIYGILECIMVAYIYGYSRFRKDIRCMLGRYWCGCMKWWPWSNWWIICWRFFTPFLLLVILITSWIGIKPLTYNNYKYPIAAEVIGWILTSSTVIIVFMPGLTRILRDKGTLQMTFKKSFKPTDDWGPALVRHRTLVAKYMGPDFVVDPWGKGVESDNSDEEFKRDEDNTNLQHQLSMNLSVPSTASHSNSRVHFGTSDDVISGQQQANSIINLKSKTNFTSHEIFYTNLGMHDQHHLLAPRDIK